MDTFLALVPALALMVAVLGLARLVRETRRENRRQRQQATINYITSTIQRQHELYGEIERDPSFPERAAIVNSAEFHQLTSYFGYMEYLAAAVNMEVFDAKVVDRTIGGRLIRACEDFREWIEAERQRLANPAVYEELQALVDDLRRRRALRAPSSPGEAGP
ncbi:DUF4760 domain-containing protein [Nocardia lijiangensis]|uniref:DUF4760 domain-containing protein n=1 Tax=Nocardia lijiangensis TaxID=299618 RepID=UPI0008328748|nr:DUF4760 domain-containing protein [Nocardia lijiangensis]